jgi:hypothetical protein
MQSGYKEEINQAAKREYSEVWDASVPGYELRIELSWQLQNNGKKGNRLWKEDFMCDLKRQWDDYKSITRIWLVKTENPSACVTINWSCVV